MLRIFSGPLRISHNSFLAFLRNWGPLRIRNLKYASAPGDRQGVKGESPSFFPFRELTPASMMSFLDLSEGLQGRFTGHRMIDHGEGIVPPENDAGTGQRQFADIGGGMDTFIIKGVQFR